MHKKFGFLMFMIGLFLALSVAQGEEKAIPYFNVSGVSNTGPYTVLIVSVTDNSPAQIGGIRPGDRVLAFDGIRIRSLFEFKQYLNYFTNKSAVQVTVRRGSENILLNVKDIPNTRMIGCILHDESPSIWNMLLKRWNIKPDDFLDLPPKAHNDADVQLDAIIGSFMEASPPPASPVVTQVAYFPARAQEALWTLGASHSDAARNWVIGLFKVYCAIVCQHYGEVDALIAKYGLLKTSHDPFLDSLVRFYTHVAKSPPSLEKSVPLKEYGVDAMYFAVCYPYPFVPERRSNWFSFDPGFEQLFNKATSGDAELEQKVSEAAMNYAYRISNSPSSYLNRVKAAIIDQNQHGGWPMRHTVLYKEESLLACLSTLKENLDKHPQESVPTAFALLAPSLLADDLASFTKSYKIIFDAGTRELGTANSFIANTLRLWSLQRPKHLAVQLSINNKLPIPEVYTVLSRLSPDIKERAQKGYFIRQGQCVQDLGAFCKSDPYLVARALTETSPQPLP
ncbi:MAG: PDZ domain-containing protein [bacterium]